MNILSIDVGIKNLAYCLFFIQPNKQYEIMQWHTVNLVETIPYTVSSGAYTAGQSVALTAEIDSYSVDLLPKRIITRNCD